MSRLLSAALLLSAGFALTIHASAQGISRETMPPKTGHEIVPTKQVVPGTGSAVKVLLLKSWGTTSGWEDLKTQWMNFGKVPITIDDTTYIDSDFTYADLVNSGADVIVLSDPAGGNKPYTSTDIAAVAQYATAGHAVVGTFAVFEWGSTDNRGLMPVFGLNSSLIYNADLPISNSFTQVAPKSCLFQNLSSTWQSSGWAFSQAPQEAGIWTHNALDLAFPVAEGDSNVAVISVYNGGKYAGVYISNYPEYFGGTDDMQLLYNAVTCFALRK